MIFMSLGQLISTILIGPYKLSVKCYRAFFVAVPEIQKYGV